MSNEFNGLDEAVEVNQDVEAITTDKVVQMKEAKKRRPFAYWKVGDKELKLKLNASMIQKIESKFRNRSLLSLIMDADGTPSLAVMLTVIQGAAIPWQHGISYSDIEHLYDEWVDAEGGDQNHLLADVVIPILSVSGFFTQEQTEMIRSELEENR